MSKPSERGFTRDDEDMVEEENFLTAGERSTVEKDEKTVSDDAGDYVFLIPRRKKKKKRRSSSSYNKTSESLVASRRDPHQHSHHHSHHRKHKMKPWKKVLISIACVFVALALIFTGTMMFLIFRGHDELFISDIQIVAPEGLDAIVKDDGKFIIYNGSTYKYNEDLTSILFMGIDERDLEIKNEEGTGGQADVIVVMAIDLKKRKLTLVNIPRDTMTDVAVYSVGGHFLGMERQQICLSYAYGDGKETSCKNTEATVRRIFYNVPVSTYYSLDLDGIAAVNDAIGGVDVISPETIGQFEEGKSYHLVGDNAELFVRDRVHDRADANTLRMNRQQTYAKSFMNTVMTRVKRNPAYAVDLFNSSSPYSCTDLTPAKITYLAQDIARNGSLSAEIVTVPGETTLNRSEQAEFNINEKEFYEQFLSVFYEKM